MDEIIIAIYSVTFVTVLCLAFIPATIAKRKGYSFAGYYVFGVLLFLPALIVALVVQDKTANSKHSNVSNAEDNIDRLLKCKKLLDEGVITQEEFDEKKRQLLSDEQPIIDHKDHVSNDGAHASVQKKKKDPLKVAKALSVASVAVGILGLLLLVCLGGMSVLFKPPFLIDFVPMLPAHAQVVLLAVVAGIVQIVALSSPTKRNVTAAILIEAIPVLVWTLGFVYSFVSVASQSISAVVYRLNPFSIYFFFAFLFFIPVVAAGVSAYLLYRNAEQLGVSASGKEMLADAAGGVKSFFVRRWKAVVIAVVAVAVVCAGAYGIWYWSLPSKAFAVYSDDDNSLTFYKDKTIPGQSDEYQGKEATKVYENVETTIYGSSTDERPEWCNDEMNEVIESVRFDDVIKPKSCAAWFWDMSNCTSIDLVNLDTSECENFSFMFCNCENLESLDVSGFDTSKSTDFTCMFTDCEKVDKLDVNGFETNAAESFAQMFGGCSSLEAIDVSGFSTANATEFNVMFSECSQLKELDVSGFDTSKATTMVGMFSYCSSLRSIDVSGFATSNVESMYGMFAGCESLIELDVFGFNTSNCKYFGNEYSSGMFAGCSSLERLDGAEKWDTHLAESFYNMFYGCRSLELDCSQWDVSGVDSAEDYEGFNHQADGVTAPDWSAHVSKAENGGTSVSGGGWPAGGWESSGTTGTGGAGRPQY